jgi:hypothetical protein
MVSQTFYNNKSGLGHHDSAEGVCTSSSWSTDTAVTPDLPCKNGDPALVVSGCAWPLTAGPRNRLEPRSKKTGREGESRPVKEKMV